MNNFRNLKFKRWTVDANFGFYENGRVAIMLDSKEDGPIAKASVNMPDAEYPDNEVFVKDYSENEGMAAWLAENGIIEREPTGREPSGWVQISRYPLTQRALEIAGAAGTA